MSAGVLIIDDDSAAALSLIKALKLSLPALHFHAASTTEKAIELFLQLRPAVVVLDLHLEVARGVESGFALEQKLLALDSTARIIVLTGHSNVEHGVRALTLGASSFLEKPADLPHLAALIRDAVSQSELRRAYLALNKERVHEISSVVCGESSAIQKVREAVSYASQTVQPVLLLGETGTGKGLCAWAIHDFGRRRAAKFVRYQPTFATPDLVNSDLFGHARGSFTGALAERRGLLLEADQGTLFLDEIEELPLETQVSLLGVLQDKRVRRVGSDSEFGVDFRLICASNEDPVRAIEASKLRKDFYHRIAHFVIEIPALRERKEDIAALSLLALSRLRERESLHVFEIEEAAMQVLQSREWPGNVRELEAVVEGAAYRAHFLGRSILCEQDFFFTQRPAESSGGGFHEKVEAYKLSLIQDALRASGGNQVHAAKALGVDRSALRRILVKDSSSVSSSKTP
ncbi:MAG: sigma-54-dependent Fis family transcriptional regulator [Deltaproteobacteria bacterium]|nr:sigma-54-dependent Fis family transcriptional regulator [Deltaproteobacteria bacterium]